MLFQKTNQFLQTPNFALGPEDIPTFEQGRTPSSRITLHRLRAYDTFDLDEAKRHCDHKLAAKQSPSPAVCYSLGLQVDAVFRGTKPPESQPPAIILDFLYGVASYALWKSGNDVHAVLKKYRQDHYASIPTPPRAPLSDDDSPDEKDDPLDSDYNPGPSGKPKIVEGGVRRGYKMVEAMDELNLVLMLLCGTTPDEVARRREKEMEEEEQRAQEAGRSKVVNWLKTDTA